MAFPDPPDPPDDIPQHQLDSLNALRHEFATDPPLIKHITDEFVKVLEQGLTDQGGDIAMNITWVTRFPTGHEQGRYLTLDMGGTNLRVCEIILSPQPGEYEALQRKYKLPGHLRSAPGDDLWDFAADCVGSFLHEHHQGGQCEEKLPLAFTFSYPVEQTSIKSGKLQHWTKDFSSPGVEGHDVVLQLEEALERKKVPVTVVSLVNDTTGTLIASAYKDPEVKVGSIVSTGCNSAYMEQCSAIPKLQHANLPPNAQMAINTEYGAFDNSCRVLRRTRFDIDLDKTSPRPGQQLYEKMVAGLYMGEIARRILLELHDTQDYLNGQDVSMLHEPHILDSSFLSGVETDDSDTREGVQRLMHQKLNLTTTLPDRRICRYVVELVGMRSARLYACGIAAIFIKRGMQSGKVGVDGSVFNHYARFRMRASQALRDIFDWPEGSKDAITFQMSEDGSGTGAALIAALTTNTDGVDGGVDGVDGI